MYDNRVQDALEGMCKWAELLFCMTNKLIDDIDEMADVYIIHVWFDRKTTHTTK